MKITRSKKTVVFKEIEGKSGYRERIHLARWIAENIDNLPTRLTGKYDPYRDKWYLVGLGITIDNIYEASYNQEKLRKLKARITGI